MKVFFDTNVLIAAFATRGLSADLFAHVLLEHDLVVGDVVLTELRTQLRTKLKLPKKTIDEIEVQLRGGLVVKASAKSQIDTNVEISSIFLNTFRSRRSASPSN